MHESGGRRRRRLSQEETELWEGVTRSIAPLHRRARNAVDDEADVDGAAAVETPPPSTRRKAQKPAPAPDVPPVAVKPKAPPPLAPIDRKTKSRIARGTHGIDARIDLHGHTQAQAHGALLRFLRNAHDKGASVVLVITGKGVRGEGASGMGERGVLKRQVPLWLRLPEFREYVVGFDDAAIGHGGEGALYVRIRKRRG